MKKMFLTVLMALALLFCTASASADLVLPKGTTDIADEAFLNAKLSYYLTIPDGVKTIGHQAFAGSSAVQVKLPASLTYIALDAFSPNASFEVLPGSYARQWCIDNDYFYDEMRVFVNTEAIVSYADKPAVLKAKCSYPEQVDFYRWETSSNLMTWQAVPDQTGSSIQVSYVDNLKVSYVRCRASVNGVLLEPANYATVTYKPGTVQFSTEKSKALSGDAIYLEWTDMGTGMQYYLSQWIPDASLENGGRWQTIESRLTFNSYTVYGLEKNTEYKFQIGIVEDGEANILSKPFAITTGEEPTTLKMKETKMIGNSFHMSWEPIKNAVYDSYFGYDQNNMRLFSSNLWATEYHLYNTSKTNNSYVQIRARIPNTGYVFWGPICEIEANSEEPVVEIESCEMKGDILNLSWKTLPGCIYDVYLHMDGEEEFCAIKDTSKTAIEYGGFRPGEHGTVRVVAKFGGWAKSSDEVEISVPLLNEVEYRALLIGEVSFKGSMYSGRCYGDVELLAKMLKNVKTPDGTFYSVIRRKDLNRQQVFAAIQEAFGTADENDVSLIYFGTHGDVSHVGRLAGSLCTVEVPNKTYDVILMEELGGKHR